MLTFNPACLVVARFLKETTYPFPRFPGFHSSARFRAFTKFRALVGQSGRVFFVRALVRERVANLLIPLRCAEWQYTGGKNTSLCFPVSWDSFVVGYLQMLQYANYI